MEAIPDGDKDAAICRLKPAETVIVFKLVAETREFDGSADTVHFLTGRHEDLVCSNALWLNVFVTYQRNCGIRTFAKKFPK